MDITLIVQIFVLALLFCLGAFFSGVETALITLSRSKTKFLMSQYPNKAKHLEIWLKQPNEVLTTLLVGINVVAVASATLSAAMANHFSDHFNISKVLLTFASGFLVTIIIIVFGEIAPKIFAIHNAEKVSIHTIRPLYYINMIITPVTNFFTRIAVLIIKMFGGQYTDTSPIVTREEIKLMVRLGNEEGILKSQEGDMLGNVFRFSEKIVKNVMIKKEDVVFINIDDTTNNILKIAAEEGFTRMPVYKNDINNIIGIIHTKELLNIWINKKLFILVDLIRPPYFINEDIKISDLLAELKKIKRHMAVVKNKEGEIAGLITLEDVIEEIVGDISYEHTDKEDQR